jgi:hypothetical protein
MWLPHIIDRNCVRFPDAIAIRDARQTAPATERTTHDFPSRLDTAARRLSAAG